MRKTKGCVMCNVLCVICAVLIAGCVTPAMRDKATNPGLLEPQAVLKFSDVPIPAGFKSLPKESYSFETAGVRVGMLKYQGKGNPELVVNFYKEQMAMYNWFLLNVVEYGERLMNYDRQSETCIIGIASKGNSVILTITLGPKAQQAVQVREKPVR